MAQSPQEFWTDVKEQRSIIRAAVEKSSLQPRDGTCYISSVFNRDRGTSKGDVCLASINLAGQRVVEGTHQLATEDEIQKLLDNHKDRAREIAHLEIKRRQSFVVNVPAGENFSEQLVKNSAPGAKKQV